MSAATSPSTQDQPGISVRPLQAADEAAWRRLWTGYLTYYETTVPDQVYQTTFTR